MMNDAQHQSAAAWLKLVGPYTIGPDVIVTLRGSEAGVGEVRIDKLGRIFGTEGQGEIKPLLIRGPVCTSDDPTNHQGDTCPVHESEQREGDQDETDAEYEARWIDSLTDNDGYGHDR